MSHQAQVYIEGASRVLNMGEPTGRVRLELSCGHQPVIEAERVKIGSTHGCSDCPHVEPPVVETETWWLVRYVPSAKNDERRSPSDGDYWCGGKGWVPRREAERYDAEGSRKVAARRREHGWGCHVVKVTVRRRVQR